MQLIRRLLRGVTFGADERAILRIPVASRGPDLTAIVDAADAWNLLFAIDGAEAEQLRRSFSAWNYRCTAPATAERLIRKRLDGETAEWEKQMVVDLLEAQSDGHRIVARLGAIYPGPATGDHREFRKGLYRLEWQLDGEDERLRRFLGASGLAWWNS